MLSLVKQWFHSLFVDPKVRVVFWSLVATALSVELPTIPDGVLPQWAKTLLLVLSGVMIPHVREFAKQQAALPSVAIIQYPDKPRDPDAKAPGKGA